MRTETTLPAGARTQHSSAPWTCDFPDYHWGASQIVSDNEPIAHALPIGSCDERNANARLIAAAPELLAIAKEISEKGYLPNGSASDNERGQRLAAAIEKAKGI